MGEMIQVKINEASQTTGYLATPIAGKGPGVLVLHEIWGLVPHIQDVSDRFAASGFTALAPDLYRGQAATSRAEARRLMMQLDAAVAEDLRAATRALLDHCSGSHVGAVGFCMGGQLALFAACQDPTIGACVDFYGSHPNLTPDLTSLHGPVLGFFGAEDTVVPPETARALEARLLAAGKQCEIHVYPGAGHAFFNDTRPEVYNPVAAQDAWFRTVQFFRQHLS